MNDMKDLPAGLLAVVASYAGRPEVQRGIVKEIIEFAEEHAAVVASKERAACAALCAERAKKALDKGSPLERKAYLAAARAIKARES